MQIDGLNLFFLPVNLSIFIRAKIKKKKKKKLKRESVIVLAARHPVSHLFPLCRELISTQSISQEVEAGARSRHAT